MTTYRFDAIKNGLIANGFKTLRIVDHIAKADEETLTPEIKRLIAYYGGVAEVEKPAPKKKRGIK